MSDAATFAADWLALREPADHRARSPELLPPLREAWDGRGWSSVVDLGSGTGSTVRWLAPRLSRPQRWTLVDRDAELLTRARESADATGFTGIDVGVIRGDLAREGLDAVAGADLVTASALLDLVGEGWLRRWVETCRAARCGVYVALTWDGTVEWSGASAEPPAGAADDARILAAVREHQERDKGTGRALGARAGGAAEELLRAAGYETHRAASPWRLEPGSRAGDAELARALIRGWADAAGEVLPGEAEGVEAWARWRTATVTRGKARLTVGHDDLLALLPEAPGGRP